jgi:hypothetical protein
MYSTSSVYPTPSVTKNCTEATYTKCHTCKVCTDCFSFACIECFMNSIQSHILVVAIVRTIHQRSMTGWQPCWPQCWMSLVRSWHARTWHNHLTMGRHDTHDCCSHYQKYCYRIHPIRSDSSWTASKTFSTVVHIILPISITEGRVISNGSSCWTAADNTLNYQQRLSWWIAADNLVFSSCSKPWPTADNGVYN